MANEIFESNDLLFAVNAATSPEIFHLIYNFKILQGWDKNFFSRTSGNNAVKLWIYSSAGRNILTYEEVAWDGANAKPLAVNSKNFGLKLTSQGGRYNLIGQDDQRYDLAGTTPGPDHVDLFYLIQSPSNRVDFADKYALIKLITSGAILIVSLYSPTMTGPYSHNTDYWR